MVFWPLFGANNAAPHTLIAFVVLTRLIEDLSKSGLWSESWGGTQSRWPELVVPCVARSNMASHGPLLLFGLVTLLDLILFLAGFANESHRLWRVYRFLKINVPGRSLWFLSLVLLVGFEKRQTVIWSQEDVPWVIIDGTCFVKCLLIVGLPLVPGRGRVYVSINEIIRDQIVNDGVFS